jgi:hypothetical protein
MSIINDFRFYSDCKDSLLESFGDVEIAKNKLSRKGYENNDDLEETLIAIKESLGDKIINFFSKNLGGDISKLSNILQDMKSEEIKFVTDEHESESKFYKLSAALSQLKRDKADSSEVTQYADKLNKLKKFIKDLMSSHNSIMDDLEKQVNIITKKNNRKADYYNLKRAEDSVETKKLRADFKKKLITQAEDSEYLDDIQKILGNPKDAQKDLDAAKEVLAKEKDKIGAGGETSSLVKPDLDEKNEDFYKEIRATVKDIEDYTKKSLSKFENKEEAKKINRGTFNMMQKGFDTRVRKASNVIETFKSKISQVNSTSDNETSSETNKAITNLLNLERQVSNLKYFTWPASDLEVQKETILATIGKVNKQIEVAA